LDDILMSGMAFVNPFFFLLLLLFFFFWHLLQQFFGRSTPQSFNRCCCLHWHNFLGK
jgi:hypothetical protein